MPVFIRVADAKDYFSQLRMAPEEYRKLNKTQRRKAMQRWEAEHAHLAAALRAEADAKEAARDEADRADRADRPKERR